MVYRDLTIISKYHYSMHKELNINMDTHTETDTHK